MRSSGGFCVPYAFSEASRLVATATVLGFVGG
jgi:hypothetical protein